MTPCTNPTRIQWAVTAAFFCALHCIQGYLLTRGRDPQRHAARGREIADPANRVPMDVHRAYVALEQLSKRARYRLGVFDPGFVQRRVLDERLRLITEFVGL